MKTNKRAFSIAEALITLMIISLILAAVIPVFSKRQLTSDSMWRYVASGMGSNSDIFYGRGTTQTAIIGTDVRPAGAAIATARPRLIVVTPIIPLSGEDTIKRSLIDFYQTTAGGTVNIGRISFDQNRNIAIGSGALSVGARTDNTALGYQTLLAATTGVGNTAIGSQALVTNITSHFNTGIGCQSLGFTTGGWNTAVGASALKGSVAGGSQKNTAIGFESMFKNNTGDSNTAIGYQALHEATASGENTALGALALFSETTGTFNTAVGYDVLSQVTTNSYNTGVGYRALGSATGASNTAIGYQSCTQVTTGTGNICIGSFAGPTANDNSKLFIDNNLLTATPTGTGSLVYGDFAARKITINGALDVTGVLRSTSGTVVAIPSDRRLKNIYGNNHVGIEKLNKIQVVNFSYKNDKKKKPKVGVIAQDLQKVFPNSVLKDSDGYLSVETNEIFYAMVNSIKDMYKQVQTLIAKVSGLDTRITKLEKENLALKSQLAQINKRLDKLEK